MQSIRRLPSTAYSSHSLHCISAAPAALDRYLAALPAMSDALRDIFVIDAQRDGERFIVRVDEKLAAFVEPGSGDSSSARIVTKRRPRRPPDAQLSPRQLNSPRRRGTGWVECPGTG